MSSRNPGRGISISVENIALFAMLIIPNPGRPQVVDPGDLMEEVGLVLNF